MDLLTDPTAVVVVLEIHDNLNARTPADTINLHMDAYSEASVARSVKLSSLLHPKDTTACGLTSISLLQRIELLVQRYL